jgi:hypothetical protein
VGDSLHVSHAQPLRGSRWLRQHWLSAIKSLHLGFLVHAQHHCFVRGIQEKADDISDLLDKERISRYLEVLLPMGLEGKYRQPTVDCAL